MAPSVDTLIHEIGAGQMEIDFFHGDPLALADEVFFFKRTLREAAPSHGMYATQYAAGFIAHTEARTDSELPRLTEDEFDAFLDCTI